MGASTGIKMTQVVGLKSAQELNRVAPADQAALHTAALDWQDQELVDSIHAQISLVRESLARLQFVTEEVRYLLNLSSK